MNNTSSQESKLILVVDDNRSIRTTVRGVLEAQEYIVVDADSGESALALCEKQIPDLILMDAVMPDMDGFTCSAEIKKLFGHNSPPIIMMTVLDDRESIYRSFDVGIKEYLLKPLNWVSLNQKIARIFRSQEQHHQLKIQFGELNRLKEQLNSSVAQGLKNTNREQPSRVFNLRLANI